MLPASALAVLALPAQGPAGTRALTFGGQRVISEASACDASVINTHTTNTVSSITDDLSVVQSTQQASADQILESQTPTQTTNSLLALLSMDPDELREIKSLDIQIPDAFECYANVPPGTEGVIYACDVHGLPDQCRYWNSLVEDYGEDGIPEACVYQYCKFGGGNDTEADWSNTYCCLTKHMEAIGSKQEYKNDGTTPAFNGQTVAERTAALARPPSSSPYSVTLEEYLTMADKLWAFPSGEETCLKAAKHLTDHYEYMGAVEEWHKDPMCSPSCTPNCLPDNCGAKYHMEIISGEFSNIHGLTMYGARKDAVILLPETTEFDDDGNVYTYPASAEYKPFMAEFTIPLQDTSVLIWKGSKPATEATAARRKLSELRYADLKPKEKQRLKGLQAFRKKEAAAERLRGSCHPSAGCLRRKDGVARRRLDFHDPEDEKKESEDKPLQSGTKTGGKASVDGNRCLKPANGEEMLAWYQVGYWQTAANPIEKSTNPREDARVIKAIVNKDLSNALTSKNAFREKEIEAFKLEKGGEEKFVLVSEHDPETNVLKKAYHQPVPGLEAYDTSKAAVAMQFGFTSGQNDEGKALQAFSFDDRTWLKASKSIEVTGVQCAAGFELLNAIKVVYKQCEKSGEPYILQGCQRKCVLPTQRPVPGDTPTSTSTSTSAPTTNTDGVIANVVVDTKVELSPDVARAKAIALMVNALGAGYYDLKAAKKVKQEGAVARFTGVKCAVGYECEEKTKKTFRFYSDKKNFADAQAHCVARGGSLASLHSVSDVNAVVEQFKNVDSWIGLTRAKTSDKWSWSDGSQYGVVALEEGENAPELWKKELWHSGQGTDNTCGRWGWADSRTWDDVSCQDLNPFTCEEPSECGTNDKGVEGICRSDGYFVMSGCKALPCWAPDKSTLAPYTIQPNPVLAFGDDFQVDVKCAEGYWARKAGPKNKDGYTTWVNTPPAATSCAAPNKVYTLAGCNKIPECVKPTSVDGYDLSKLSKQDLKMDFTFSVQGIKCAEGYTVGGEPASVSASVCKEPGTAYILQGCVKIMPVGAQCKRPGPLTGSLGFDLSDVKENLLMSEFKVEGIKCAKDYVVDPYKPIRADVCQTEDMYYQLVGCLPKGEEPSNTGGDTPTGGGSTPGADHTTGESGPPTGEPTTGGGSTTGGDHTTGESGPPTVEPTTGGGSTTGGDHTTGESGPPTVEPTTGESGWW